MKTIFITISDGEVSKNILRTDIFPIIKNKAKLVLFVNKSKYEYFKKNFLSDNVLIEAIPVATFPKIEEIFSDIFLFSLHTESILVKIDFFHVSGGSFLGMSVKKLLWFFGKFFWYRQFIRLIYRLIPDRSFDHYFKKYNPDLIFAANLISNEDSRILKAARRFGVKSIGMPKGWDNLTLKTFLGFFPDLLMVPTPLMREDAMNFLDYPEKKIEVVGFSKFDIYLTKPKITREEFLVSLGLDPKKKTILYAGAGDQLAPYDEEILRNLLGVIDSGDIVVPVQILVRPHPKYVYRSEIIKQSKNWILDRPGKLIDSRQGNFEFEDRDIRHLVDTLFFCDVLIHTASTLGIEAAIFDKPSISIAFDGSEHLPSQLSVKRYYSYVHLKRVVDTGGMKVAYNFDELVGFLNDYLLNPKLDSRQRKHMLFENAYDIDGLAGRRIADFLVKNLGD